MTERTDQLRREWDRRSASMGSTQRAVLFKRFPGWLNDSIHRRHVRFIIDNCPPDPSRVLDVGCGYGRISAELARRYPATRFQGVDLSEHFARYFEQHVGPCFNGPIQDFRMDQTWNLVLVVTTLMYLDSDEHVGVIERLWSSLAPGGRIICIEPASELFVLWRRLTGKTSASPTGGTVEHFLRHQLIDKFAHLENLKVVGTRSVNLLPFVDATAVHHCVAVEKTGQRTGRA
jgi:trans-aconitate methyltransferase